MSNGKTPALWHLMAAYFNQDWDLDYADESAAIDAFIAESDDLVALLPDEIDWVLRQYPSEQEVKIYVLDTLRAEFLADLSGGTFRGWLTDVSERVRAATGQP